MQTEKYDMAREMLKILQSTMEVLKAETFVEMSEICAKYTTSGIVETTL